MMEQNGNGATNDLQFDEEMCERYLFGELTEAEQERFEASYFNDDVFFDRFIAVKTELLDLYSRGELDAEKRARMEPHFLATAPRRKRLAESKEFIQAVNAMSVRDRLPKAAVTILPEPSLFDSIARFFTLPRLASAAVLLIAAIGGIFLLSRSGQEEQIVQQPTNQVNRQNEVVASSNSTNSERQGSEPEVTTVPPDSNNTTPHRPTQPKSELAGTPADVGSQVRIDLDGPQTKTNRSTPIPHREPRRDPDQKYATTDPPDKNDDVAAIGEPDAELSITLQAGATRSVGEGNTLTIPDGARSANLKLIFRGERYRTYIVTITNVEGSEIFRKDNYNDRLIRGTKDGTRRLTVRLRDTTRIGEKDYIVKLEGRDPGKAPETIEEYYFHVRRETKTPPRDKP